jgi:hypothetical protein
MTGNLTLPPEVGQPVRLDDAKATSLSTGNVASLDQATK